MGAGAGVWAAEKSVDVSGSVSLAGEGELGAEGVAGAGASTRALVSIDCEGEGDDETMSQHVERKEGDDDRRRTAGGGG